MESGNADLRKPGLRFTPSELQMICWIFAPCLALVIISQALQGTFIVRPAFLHLDP